MLVSQSLLLSKKYDQILAPTIFIHKNRKNQQKLMWKKESGLNASNLSEPAQNSSHPDGSLVSWNQNADKNDVKMSRIELLNWSHQSCAFSVGKETTKQLKKDVYEPVIQ